MLVHVSNFSHNYFKQEGFDCRRNLFCSLTPQPPSPQNAKLTISSQAQRSGPEQHQKKLSISKLHVGGGGRRKTTTFLCMNEQNKFRPRYYEHGCLWIQNVCNPTDILSRKHVSGVRASIQAHCQHQALVTGGVSVSFPTSNVTVPRSPIMGPGTQQSILIPISN